MVLGAAKTNIAHLEGSAGIAGFLKHLGSEGRMDSHFCMVVRVRMSMRRRMMLVVVVKVIVMMCDNGLFD